MDTLSLTDMSADTLVGALADLPGRSIDNMHRQRPPKRIVLDMDSSESPMYCEQVGSAHNDNFGCTC